MTCKARTLKTPFTSLTGALLVAVATKDGSSPIATCHHAMRKPKLDPMDRL